MRQQTSLLRVLIYAAFAGALLVVAPWVVVVVGLIALWRLWT